MDDDHMPTMAEIAGWSAALEIDPWGLLTRLLGLDVGQDLNAVE